MRCRVGDEVRYGRAVTVEAEVDPAAVAAAVRTAKRRPDDRVAVSCPEPSLLHESVGCIRPEMGLRTRTALARAGRTRELTTPYDDDLDAVRAKLAEVTVGTASLDALREEVAEAEAAVERARVRAAEARGRVRERAENDLATDAAESQLDDTLADLSEAETAAIAARQAYERARERRRERRDARERRLRLEDRAANLERRARAHLVEQLRDEFRDALSPVPGSGVDPAAESNRSDPTADDPFDADPVTAALAIARLGSLSAPVVLAVDRFASPERASEFLDAPVVQV